MLSEKMTLEMQQKVQQMYVQNQEQGDGDGEGLLLRPSANHHQHGEH